MWRSVRSRRPSYPRRRRALRLLNVPAIHWPARSSNRTTGYCPCSQRFGNLPWPFRGFLVETTRRDPRFPSSHSPPDIISRLASRSRSARPDGGGFLDSRPPGHVECLTYEERPASTRMSSNRVLKPGSSGGSASAARAASTRARTTGARCGAAAEPRRNATASRRIGGSASGRSTTRSVEHRPASRGMSATPRPAAIRLNTAHRPGGPADRPERPPLRRGQGDGRDWRREPSTLDERVGRAPARSGGPTPDRPRQDDAAASVPVGAPTSSPR